MINLTDEQKAYIKTYAEKHGAQWRHHMLQAWHEGKDQSDPVLRQIRNLRINVYSINVEKL